MKVIKFGGSSLGTPERIRGVREIISVQTLPCIVVVSAFEGVTDSLSRLADLASGGNAGYKADLEKLIGDHRDFAKNLFIPSPLKFFFQFLLNNIWDETGNGAAKAGDLFNRP